MLFVVCCLLFVVFVVGRSLLFVVCCHVLVLVFDCWGFLLAGLLFVGNVVVRCLLCVMLSFRLLLRCCWLFVVGCSFVGVVCGCALCVVRCSLFIV